MIRRSLALELALVVVVSAVLLLPGIGRYSLVDPWETHYGEVARMMLQDHDLVHTRWPGTNSEGAVDEGFRSKPVLMFWLGAAGLRAAGVAKNGGYSGELATTSRTMLGLRLPFVLCAIFGLAMLWWMLARLVSRRVAWLAWLVTASMPFYCLLAREATCDMPLCATTMGALALFALAIEDGERAIPVLGKLRVRERVIAIDARHVTLALVGGMIAWQAIYYLVYFSFGPPLGVRPTVPPAIWLPAIMALMLAGVWSGAWRWLRSGLAVDKWGRARGIGERVLGMAPLTTTRQLYLLGCYSLLGIGVLAKGPPGLAVVGVVGVMHVLLRKRLRALYEGEFELKRGLLVLIATALPWHLAMYLVDGLQFVNEYLGMHILDRATADPDKSVGTFEYYTSQLGPGMWLWAALVPAALAMVLVRARGDSREGRVRALVAMWAVAGFFVFGIVQTKFHHYILPVVPAFGVLVAFLLDDMLAGRARLHFAFAAIGAAIVLLVARDMAWEPARWIDLNMFNYKRPWPSDAPWFVDPSDGFIGLGIAGALAIVLAATRFVRAGVIALCAVGLAIGVWALQCYMPVASTHWGMGGAARTYYRERAIYGEKLVYFGAGELWDDWRDVRDTWSFETAIPDALQVGQPMTITIELRKPDKEQVVEQTFELVGEVARVGDHTIEVRLAAGERGKLDRVPASTVRGRPPVRAVDADKLIAWQLYWRGENFWSQEEIWGWLPEMKTSFPNTNNVDFMKYINDRVRAPLGRRYFILTDTGRVTGPRTMLPTQRGRDSYEVLDTTSNKFGLAAFYL